MRPSGSAPSLAPRRIAPSPQHSTSSLGSSLPAPASTPNLAHVDATMKSIFAKAAIQDHAYRTKAIIVGVACFVLLLVVANSYAGGTAAPVIRRFPDQCRVGIIADLDKRSKRQSEKGSTHWHSKYQTGTLFRTPGAAGDQYSVEWDDPVDVTTTHNEAGRGCELSELVLYNNKMLTFDDRTGIMFEITNYGDSSVRDADEPFLVPRQIFMEGDGMTDKGMKVEWATVKDDLLYVGSFGKEYTNNDGSIQHSNNLWTKVLTRDGVVQHANWKGNYDNMRKVLGYEHPKYLLHEAVTWSPFNKRWYVLPRRMSHDPYDDVTDERKGANTIITANADFSDIKYSTVGKLTPERGFSSFKFLPHSRDQVIVALKSAEEAANDRQTAFMTVYQQVGDKWKVLMEETEIPGDAKFEGLEIFSCT